MADEQAKPMGLKGSKKDPTRTAREAVDRATLDAIVKLFLLRDGLVLPDEIEGHLFEETQEDGALRQLVLYAELTGMLAAEAGEHAHARLSASEKED